MPMRRLFGRRPAALPPATTADVAPAKPSRLARWQQRLREGLGNLVLFAVEGVGALGAFTGVPISLVLGRVFLAVVLAAVGLGLLMRLTGRRRRMAGSAQPSRTPLPLWQHALAALLSLIAVATLVEATRWPVRHDQPGFAPANWLWVLIALVAGYWLLSGLARVLAERRRR